MVGLCTLAGDIGPSQPEPEVHVAQAPGFFCCLLGGVCQVIAYNARRWDMRSDVLCDVLFLTLCCVTCGCVIVALGRPTFPYPLLWGLF